MEYYFDETMKYGARNNLKTATDGVLNVNYGRNIYVTNPNASPFAPALEQQTEIITSNKKTSEEVQSL